jgi:hypothetical protein
MRWASAEDPWKAIEDHRERTRLAVAKHREKKAAELTVSSKPNEPDAAATAEGKTPKPKPKPNPNPEPDDAAAVDADDGGAVKRKRRTSAEVEAERIADACSIVETTWDMSSPEVQQHLLHHILRESDPVSLALALVETMDADQVRRLMVGVEEHRAQLGRKRASQKPADGRSNVAVDDPAPENEGDDDLGDIPACLDRRQ